MDPTSNPREEIDEEAIGEDADMDDGEDPMMAMPGDDNMLSSVHPRDDDFQAFGGGGAPQTINRNDDFGEPIGEPCRSSCGCMGLCDEKCRCRTPSRLLRREQEIIEEMRMPRLSAAGAG